MTGQTTHILLVEDNPGDTFYIQNLLNDGFNTQFKLTQVDRISDACTCLESTHFDICLLDLYLPDCQGLDGVLTLKKRFSRLPIVMMTSLNDEELALQALSIGAQDYLVKDQITQIWLKRAILHAIERAHLIEDIKTSELKVKKLNLLLKEHVDKKTHKIVNMHQEVTALKILSSVDPLTQISNRFDLEKKLDQEWVRNHSIQAPLSVLMIDLDYFKQFNDKYGHVKGDNCLRQVAQTIKDTLLRPHDLVARYGGEEFVVVLSDTPEIGAKQVAEKICGNVRALAITHESSKICDQVTISIGISTNTFEDSELEPQDLIARADHALYQAKHEGRDRVVSFDLQFPDCQAV